MKERKGTKYVVIYLADSSILCLLGYDLDDIIGVLYHGECLNYDLQLSNELSHNVKSSRAMLMRLSRMAAVKEKNQKP